MLKKLNTFTIDYESEIEQKHFEGKFTARIASMMDKSKIAVRRSQLCGGMHCVRDENAVPTGRGIDEDAEIMAHMLAWLEITLVQKPGWFKFEGEDPIIDETLTMKIFEEVMKYENSFRGRNRVPAEGTEGSVQGSEGTGETESTKTVNRSAAPKMVDKEVQAALDA